MMKPWMCLLALALAAAPAQARPSWPAPGNAAGAATDRVLVLGAPKALVHTNSAPAQRSKLTFSPVGLAELALDAMGLPTGHVDGARAANPLQADVFTHTQAYALVLVDSAVSTPVLQSIDTTGAEAASFRHTYPLADGWSNMIPSVIAREFKTGFGDDATVACAGSSAICKHSLQQPSESNADEAELQQVLADNAYLDANNGADKAFAQELAQAKRLTKAVADNQKAAHAFFVLGFSSVQALEAGATREAANTALAAQISDFLTAFQTAYTNSGVQIVAAAASSAVGPQQLQQSPHAKVLDDVMSYDRMLLSFGDLSGSGSDASDDGNATASNSTAGQLSMEEIAEYQILLWTSVLLVAVLLVTVLAMVNMDVGRDSLLYAKFITDASHRKGEMNATDKRVLELFDNEALWDADDTDDFVLKVFDELEAQGEAIVTAKDLGWNTLLHTAALWNRPKIMDELIRKGAELNVANKNGHTPLDLAMHWGHHELGLQLQHYGGKHTCEKERDIAISQRDLAQEQIRECEAELMEALHRLKSTKHEREEFRIERDRLLQLHSQLSEERNHLLEQSVHLQQCIESLTQEKRTLQIKTAQLTDELATEQATRQNAVQGWKLAEVALADMQQMQENCREREEEALVMRNEALEERDIARELARQAQVDQGLARQTQIEAERERDKAIATLLDSEKEIAAEKALWRKKIAKTELDRRNIQIEIDYQTELLRAENTRLEKQLAEMTVDEARAREELVEKHNAMKHVQQENALLQNDMAAQGSILRRLEDQVAALLEERKDEHKAWRTRIEEKLQSTIAMQLKQILDASVQTWHALTRFQSRILSFDSSSKKSSSPISKSITNAFSVVPKRPNTTTSAAASGIEKASRLPFLPEKMPTMKTSSSLPAFSKDSTPETALSCPDDLAIQIGKNSQLAQYWITRTEPLLQLGLNELKAAEVVEPITALCSALQEFMDLLTDFVVKNLQHLRKQAEAHEKMIERKDELIQRFNHHRQENLKKERATKFRECSIRPLI